MIPFLPMENSISVWELFWCVYSVCVSLLGWVWFIRF